MIDYTLEIGNDIKCLPDTMFVKMLEYGERKTKSGIIVPTEKMDRFGHFVRPRWAKVIYKADNIKDIDVGDYLLLEHGNWSTYLNLSIKNKDTKLWYVSPKSYHVGAMMISKTFPKGLEEYVKEEDV